MTRILLAIVLIIIILLGGSAEAQPTVTRVTDMAFGTMFPGVPKTIDKQSTDAVEFQVTGTAGAEVALQFTLPEYMSSGGYTLQVIFYDDACAIDTSATPNQSSPAYNDLNPYQTLIYRLGSTGLTVWLGAKAIPGLRQESGSYTGDVVLSAEYTGN